MPSVTPMMQQYLDIKAQYEGHILLYRLGDFFEMFFSDAVEASRALELTLTGRDCGNGNRAAMCGVPFHKADVYIGRLVEKGYKVAVCEQTEDPATAKGLVRREIVRVITPGTVTDGSLLAETKNNYLAAIFYAKSGVGLGFADISTGQVSVTVLDGADLLSRMENELGIFAPREVILNVSENACREVCEFLRARFDTFITEGREDLFDEYAARTLVGAQFADTAHGLDTVATCAVGALLSYIRETQKTAVSFARELTVYADGQAMEIDISTRRNLELTESMRNKEKKGSLLWVLDKTQTSMGARMLRSWILRPLINPAPITARQQAVSELLSDYMTRAEIRELFASVLDLERLTAKAVYGTANAKDLRAICQSLAVLPALRAHLQKFTGQRLRELYDHIDTLEDLCTLLDNAISPEPPFSLRDGGLIRDGYDRDVDYLRSILANGQGWIEEIEVQEREATGIKNLKVSYNKVFGYYIEVTKSQISMVPDRYIRKQTLANCERYITQELKEMESTVLGAADKLTALEYSLFVSVRDSAAAAASRIQVAAATVAEVDVYLSLAEVASKNNYVCPEVDTSEVLEITDGRHPVVEKFVTSSYFVPNDTKMDTAGNRLLLITGPNMAGKSTYMRQVALIAVMAQIGSFVPAKAARIGIVDKLFTRVGASDDLASGQSTFMLEMNEVANILQKATRRSLVIYDEVGRGTSTYDGMSIARAVAEYTAGRKLGARTLFATHYHELTALEDELDGVVNYNIAAKKHGDSITFLRKIVRGATDDSYGIEVAKLAGVPNEVVRRAKEILSGIESGDAASVHRVKKETAPAAPDMLTSLADMEAREAAEKIRRIDINTITPIEAMNFIFELKKLVSTDPNT
ncbi:MAG: DNA mismatch repair protein MutS [Clostridia bacterium]|nr:DNA mismatch repair protein MutS [Clostridia bacterium]